MSRNTETIIQDLALAAINGNMERAERLIVQIRQENIEKIARGGFALVDLALKFLPEGTGKEILREREEKEKSAKAGA